MRRIRQRRAARRRILAWLAAACGLMLLVLGGLGLYRGWGSAHSGYPDIYWPRLDTLWDTSAPEQEPPPPYTPPSPAPAGVFVGQALVWRTLALDGSIEPYRSQALSGQFDADDDTELLLLSESGASRLVQPEGKVRQVGVACPEVMEPWAAWDYDGDGRDELVATCSVRDYLRTTGTPQLEAASASGQANLSLLTPVLDLDGRVVAQLTGQGSLGAVSGRFTGQQAQLVLQDATQPEHYKRIFYGRRGVKAGVLPLPDPGFIAGAGDLDGDGKQEVVDQFLPATGEVRLRAFGPRQPVQLLYEAEFTGQFHVLDVTGDGRAEVFTSISAYHDFATGSDVQLDWPAELSPVLSERNTAASLACGDFLDTRRRLIAVGYGVNLGVTAVLLFEPGGKCVYYEELGEAGAALAGLERRGKDMLCVALRDRVLLYP